MPLVFRKFPKPILIFLALCLTLAAGMGVGWLHGHVWSEDGRFERFSQEIFEAEVSGNLLNLHYSLAYPEKKGITRPAPVLGTVSSDMDDTYRIYEKYLEKLKSFSPQKLSRENQITLDTLLLCFDTQLSLGDHVLLEEMLSPNLGIQAQLPVLLAEYAFYEDQDVSDYLNLLTSVGTYFESILAFEKEKSAAGLFMSDTSLDRVLEQCRAFIREPEENYMLEVFDRKIEEYGKFSGEEADRLKTAHKKILTEQMIPAYEKLIAGLEELRGTGTSSRGLAHFEGGKEYYEYLLKSQVGTYEKVPAIQKRMLKQLAADLRLIRLMVQEQPSLIRKLMTGTDSSDSIQTMSPTEMLASLQKNIQEDFPVLGDVSYEVRYVHKSMEEYLSPAFYLTPPLDTRTPNVIYINRASQNSQLELFSTLAHEGFPGHLYQTVYFENTEPSDVRDLFSSGGYVEGWATYVESYAAGCAAPLLNDKAAQDLTRLAWLNRSVNLCLYSLLDIGIHWQGWTQTQADHFLGTFGITDTSITREIYQYIVETPANYLKYYWGYLNFSDLKSEQEEALGDTFDLKDFHRTVLEIGPVPFPVLEKYISSYSAEKSR